MKKDKFIENLKENNQRKNDILMSASFPTIAFLSLCGYLFAWFFNIEWLFKFEGLLIPIIITIGYSINEKIQIKNIDNDTSFFCQSCNEPFNEKTLAYAVLVNECPNCKNEIYET